MHKNHTRSTRPGLKVKARHPRKHLLSRKNDMMQFTVLNIFQCSFCFTLTLKKSKIAWANFPVINTFIQCEASSRDFVVNKALLWGRQNHNTLKVAQNFLTVGLLRSKWHLWIHTRSVSYITQAILWKSHEVCNWYKFVGIIFWVLSRTVVQNGEFRHKPSTVNCFNYLWSDVKQEPKEQLKFLAYWLNSVISYKHRWLDR